MVNIYKEDVIVRTFMLFFQAARAVSKYADAYLYRKGHISLIQFIALKALSHNDGTMTPTMLAKWTQTERHNITTLVQRMKSDELITSEHDSNDRRVINITITKKGQEVLEQARPVAEEIVSQMMTSITESDAAQFENVLHIVKQNAESRLDNIFKRTYTQTS